MENEKAQVDFVDSSFSEMNHPIIPVDNIHIKEEEVLQSVNLDKNELNQGKDELPEKESQEEPHLQYKDSGKNRNTDQVLDETESSKLRLSGGSSDLFVDPDQESRSYAWPEKAVALKNFVKEKSAVAVSTVLRRLSGRKDEDESVLSDGEEIDNDVSNEQESGQNSQITDDPGEQSTWNPLNLIKIPWDLDLLSKSDHSHDVHEEYSREEPIKGRIIVYTRLKCQDCKEVRLFMHQKRLKYIEINIDVYPSRKLELEKNTGSSAVPRVYFNDLLIGGLADLKSLDESGKLDEKINYVITEEPTPAAPFPPLSGEDDASGSGVIDEFATVLRKMKETVMLRDRFYKMRLFSNCFLGSEAVDFLSEDQYLEREEAVEFGRKLVAEHFFHHVLNENTFEDGNDVYRFLEHDPVVLNQCYNIPRGLLDVKPKRIADIGARLRFLSYAIFEAYVSEDGKHVDYRSILCSEEFRRYLRIIEELHRVELEDMSREEKLSFFINLYNMMAIHAILTWSYPISALDRRKFVGDFKYVIGGCAYSLSEIYNGILRGNQRPPYNLTKPFGAKDRRAKVVVPYLEPLVHFALVSGARSGPALRFYSPGNIDQELMEAARNFLRNGGIYVDAEAKVVSASKILKWFSVDFGKNEVEVIKHAANYLEQSKTEEFLELLANTHLRVTYQPYDWGLNC